MLIDTDILFRE